MVQGFRFRSVRASGTLQRRPRHRGLKGGRLKADGRLQPMPLLKERPGSAYWQLNGTWVPFEPTLSAKKNPMAALLASPYLRVKAMPRINSRDQSTHCQSRVHDTVRRIAASARRPLRSLATRQTTLIPLTFGEPRRPVRATASIAAPGRKHRARPKERFYGQQDAHRCHSPGGNPGRGSARQPC
jgi:hypothetical protein